MKDNLNLEKGKGGCGQSSLCKRMICAMEYIKFPNVLGVVLWFHLYHLANRVLKILSFIPALFVTFGVNQGVLFKVSMLQFPFLKIVSHSWIELYLWLLWSSSILSSMEARYNSLDYSANIHFPVSRISHHGADHVIALANEMLAVKMWAEILNVHTWWGLFLRLLPRTWPWK